LSLHNKPDRGPAVAGHAASDKLSVDYSSKKIAIVDRETGVVREAGFFDGALGASSYTYAEATWTQTLPDWIGAEGATDATAGT
jgi:transposase